MITFMIICAVIAAIAPIWLIFEIEEQIHWDDDGNLTKDSVPVGKSVFALVCGILTMCFLFVGCMILYEMSQPEINTAHQLRSLQDAQIYNVLQKYEHHWRTYYYVEHPSGEGGLYWAQTDGGPELGLGYHKLERKRHNSEKLKFTPICNTERNYCAT